MLERVLVHWPLKLLAVFLAFAIWLSVTDQNWIVQDFRVPLDMRLAPDRTLASTTPTTVTVRLRGPETLFRKMDPLLLAVRPDLADAATGHLEVQLSDADLRGVPVGMQVAFIEPSRLSLTLENFVRRELPVVPDLVGEPASGSALYDAVVEPPTLTVEGPESEVLPLEHLRTSPIRLDGRAAGFVQRASAVPEGPQVRIADNRPLTVRVTIDVAPVERIFEGVRVGETPERVRVAVSGPPALVAALGAGQIRAVLDDPPVQGAPPEVRLELVGVATVDRPRLRVKVLGRTPSPA